MARRGVKILVWALAAAAGLGLITAGGLLLLAGSHFARDWLLDRARQELSARSGIELSFGSASGRLLTGLELRNLRLASGGRAFFTAGRVVLRPNPLALMGGRLTISRLVLEDPSLSLPLPTAGGGGGGGPLPLALSLKRVEVVRGSLNAGGTLGALSGLNNLALTGRLSLDARGLTGRAKITAGRARIAGSRLPLSLTGSARLEDGRLQLADLRLAMGPNTVRGKGEVDLDDLSLRARLDATLNDADSLPAAWPLPHKPPGPLELSLDATGRTSTLRYVLRLKAGTGVVKAGGTADLTAPAVKGELTLTGLDPARLGLGQSGELTGSADFEAHFSGKGSRASLKLKLGPGSLAGVQMAALDGQATWQDGSLTLERLEASGPWGRATAQGSYAPAAGGASPRVDATASFTRLTAPPRLAALLPPRLRRATLSGSLKARSSKDGVLLDLNLGPSQVSADVAVNSLRAEGVWGPKGPALHRLALTGPLAELKAEGRLDAAGGEMDFRLTLPSLADLGPLWGLAGLRPPQDLAGSLQAEGRFGGTWGKPSLNLKATVQDPAAAGVAVANLEVTLAAHGPWRHPLGRAEIKAGGLNLGDVHLDSTRVVVELARDAAHAELSANGPEGSVALRLSSADAPGPAMRCRLNGLTIHPAGRGPWSQQGEAWLSLAEGHLSLEGLSLAAGSQRLLLSGSWQSDGVRGRIAAENLDLGPWLPPELAAEPGRVSFKAELDGTLGKPRLKIKGGIAGLKGAGLPATSVSFDGRYAEGMLRLAGSSHTAGWPSLDLSASLRAVLSLHPPVFDPAPDGLKVQVHGGSLPLALLEPLIPGVSQVRGQAELSLTVDGGIDTPHSRGTLTVTDGSLTIDATGQRVDEVNLLLRLRGRRVDVERASCRAGKRLHVSGWLDLPLGKGGALDLRVKGEGIKASLGALGETVTDLALTMDGPWSGPVIKGKLIPRQLRIIPSGIPSESMDEVVELKPGQKPPPLVHLKKDMTWRPGGVLGRSTMDVEADLSHGLRVKVNEGFVELAGRVRVSKKPGGPLLYHDSVRLSQGRLILAGRAFLLTGGRMRFRDRSEPNPDIWVRAVLRTGRNRITVNVSGTARDPVLNLTSEPPMSQADILSTIIFGQPARSLSSTQSQGLSAQALALLGLKGAKEIEAFLGPELAPDVVTVHEDYASGSSLEAGKYLGQDLYLRYRQNMGQEGGQNLGLEYRLNRYFSLESQVGNTRDTGVDILFNYDFGRSTRPLLKEGKAAAPPAAHKRGGETAPANR